MVSQRAENPYYNSKQPTVKQVAEFAEFKCIMLEAAHVFISAKNNNKNKKKKPAENYATSSASAD